MFMRCFFLAFFAVVGLVPVGAVGVDIPQTSTFDTDLDGWTLGPTYENVMWMPSESGSGGYVVCQGIGPGLAQISAPSRFLGSWSALERRAAITWDFRFSADFGYQGQVSPCAVGISGPGGSATFAAQRIPVVGHWMHVVAPLYPEYWQTQPGPWPAPLASVLANVTQMWIRVEVVNGYGSTHYTDNIAIVPLSPADLNGDQHVDFEDWVFFDTCRSGPAVPVQLTAPCPYADLDYDGDVDLDDFGVFQRCYSGPVLIADAECAQPGPHIVDASHTPCEHNYPTITADDYPWCGDDQLDVLVQGASLQVTHRNIAYNCCLTDIDVTLDVTGRTLRFFETEILGQPCPCLCCYDQTTTVSGITPGVYHIEYCWQDWGVGYTCVARDEVVAP
jgi:hypothetical protein